MKKILFISNGHGEDLNGSLIAQSLRSICHKLITIDSFPIVGVGNAYQNKNIKIVSPLQSMPSGGIFYLNPLNFLQDLSSGLIGLTAKQIATINQIKNNYSFVVAVGDVVPLIFAYLTGKNYASFIVSTSSYYEGKLKLPLITKLLLRSSRCQQIFTRDQFTATDLQNQGFPQAIFKGYPIMDTLQVTGKDLALKPAIPTIALLAGSRLPEALRNLQLQLFLVEKLAAQQGQKWQFRAALVPSITDRDLTTLAMESGWQYQEQILTKTIDKQTIEVRVYNDAFADILAKCDLAVGMAGTAVEQAVGLGKPVVQIPGNGPQFTYPFAEAQMRLLGLNVCTIDDNSDRHIICTQAAQKISEILNDKSFLKQCIANGKERVGDSGGSLAIARRLLNNSESRLMG